MNSSCFLLHLHPGLAWAWSPALSRASFFYTQELALAAVLLHHLQMQNQENMHFPSWVQIPVGAGRGSRGWKAFVHLEGPLKFEA